MVLADQADQPVSSRGSHGPGAVGEAFGVPGILDGIPMEFGSSLRAIAEGEVDVTPMITAEVDLDGVPQAFQDLADPEAHCKILVVP